MQSYKNKMERTHMLRWIKERLLQRTGKTKSNIVKLNWKKAELEKLLAQKENMTPEEFRRAYNNLIQ